jgi:hypothetical protein
MAGAHFPFTEETLNKSAATPSEILLDLSRLDAARTNSLFKVCVKVFLDEGSPHTARVHDLSPLVAVGKLFVTDITTVPPAAEALLNEPSFGRSYTAVRPWSDSPGFATHGNVSIYSPSGAASGNLLAATHTLAWVLDDDGPNSARSNEFTGGKGGCPTATNWAWAVGSANMSSAVAVGTDVANPTRVPRSFNFTSFLAAGHVHRGVSLCLKTTALPQFVYHLDVVRLFVTDLRRPANLTTGVAGETGPVGATEPGQQVRLITDYAVKLSGYLAWSARCPTTANDWAWQVATERLSHAVPVGPTLSTLVPNAGGGAMMAGMEGEWQQGVNVAFNLESLATGNASYVSRNMRLCWLLSGVFHVYDLGGLSDLSMYVTDLQLTMPPIKPIGAVPMRLFSRNPAVDAFSPDDEFMLVDTNQASRCPHTVDEWAGFASVFQPQPVKLVTGSLYNGGRGHNIYVDMRAKEGTRHVASFRICLRHVRHARVYDLTTTMGGVVRIKENMCMRGGSGAEGGLYQSCYLDKCMNAGYPVKVFDGACLSGCQWRAGRNFKDCASRCREGFVGAGFGNVGVKPFMVEARKYDEHYRGLMLQVSLPSLLPITVTAVVTLDCALWHSYNFLLLNL